MSRKLLFLFFSLFLVFFLSACFKAKDRTDLNIRTNEPQPEPVKILTEAEQEQNYQIQVKDILKPYWQKQGLAGIKDKILVLRAPAEYLDLHFNLVVALEVLEQGKNSSDQEKVEEGMAQLEALKSRYPWLGEENNLK